MIDLYAILGIGRNASQQDIKRAYRKLAMRYHPDSGGSNASSELFNKISKAYQILSVPSRRAWYDNKRVVYERRRDFRQQQRQRARSMAVTRARYYQQARERDKKALYQRRDFQVATLSLMILFLTIFLFNDLRYLVIRKHNTKTIGQVYSTLSFNNDSRNLHYKYMVGDSLYYQHESRATRLGQKRIITGKGIPVLRNYEFLVWYNPRHPGRSIIDLDHPNLETINELKRKAAKRLTATEKYSAPLAKCLVDKLYNHKGLDGLGHILCKNLSWIQNPQHNRKTYRKLKKSDFWEKAIRQCPND